MVIIDDDILQAELLGERGKPPLVANSVPTLFQYNNFKSDSKRVLSEQRRIRKEKEEVRSLNAIEKRQLTDQTFEGICMILSHISKGTGFLHQAVMNCITHFVTP